VVADAVDRAWSVSWRAESGDIVVADAVDKGSWRAESGDIVVADAVDRAWSVSWRAESGDIVVADAVDREPGRSAGELNRATSWLPTLSTRGSW